MPSPARATVPPLWRRSTGTHLASGHHRGMPCGRFRRGWSDRGSFGGADVAQQPGIRKLRRFRCLEWRQGWRLVCLGEQRTRRLSPDRRATRGAGTRRCRERNGGRSHQLDHQQEVPCILLRDEVAGAWRAPIAASAALGASAADVSSAAVNVGSGRRHRILSAGCRPLTILPRGQSDAQSIRQQQRHRPAYNDPPRPPPASPAACGIAGVVIPQVRLDPFPPSPAPRCPP